MKARTKITLVLAMIAALLVATPGVGAQEPNTPTDQQDPELSADSTVLRSQDEALRAQAQLIVADEGGDYNQVLRRLEYEVDVTARLETLEESGSLTTFAGGAFSDDGSLATTWYFKGEVPELVTDAIGREPVEGLTLQGGAKVLS